MESFSNPHNIFSSLRNIIIQFRLDTYTHAENVGLSDIFWPPSWKPEVVSAKTTSNFFFLIEKHMNVNFRPDAYTCAENVAVNYDIPISFGRHLGNRKSDRLEIPSVVSSDLETYVYQVSPEYMQACGKCGH